MEPTQFFNLIQRVLRDFEAAGGPRYSDEAVHMLFMIAAHESYLGFYLEQVKGPALGAFQMEPPTLRDVLHNTSEKNRAALQMMTAPMYQAHPEKGLDGCLTYAICVARLMLVRFSEPLPRTSAEMAVYAKKYWNTELGKATPEQYRKAYLKFISPTLAR